MPNAIKLLYLSEGFLVAIEHSADDHCGTERWKIVEDLRPHLDSLVKELGRMPTNSELCLRKCGALVFDTVKLVLPHLPC